MQFSGNVERILVSSLCEKNKTSENIWKCVQSLKSFFQLNSSLHVLPYLMCALSQKADLSLCYELLLGITCACWQHSPSERRWFICRQAVYVGESNRERRATHKASTCPSDCVSTHWWKAPALLLISSQSAPCAWVQSCFGNEGRTYLKRNVEHFCVDIRR